jgi:hypothetical protein
VKLPSTALDWVWILAMCLIPGLLIGYIVTLVIDNIKRA